ncbi:MAG: zeta toxin family protein [Thermodesulfobacteriota bacterium]|nr:zeta toxin family protein [Thermodesulfobacteriota bacterium]
MKKRPNIVVIAGPNGAGKSTTASRLLHGALSVSEFVNADDIAASLSPNNPEKTAIQASRLMLKRLEALTQKRKDFAFETTLSARGFPRRIAGLIKTGYIFRLIFLWLPSPDMAKARVKLRVRTGGHDVPEDVIERRYHSGLRNFFEYYQPMALDWRFYDNSGPESPRLIALGNSITKDQTVYDHETWAHITRAYAMNIK